MANNKVVITFNRDFTDGDTLEVLVGAFQLASLLTFTWVTTTPAGFEVAVGTPTGNVGETTATNLLTSWDSSISGYSLSRNVNELTIITPDENTFFISVVAKDSVGNTYAIPGDYEVTISTEAAEGFPITYSDKVSLNPITGNRVNLWKDLDANEVKTQHNNNNLRINQNVTDIANNTASIIGKADLTGGNEFTGNQIIDGSLSVINNNNFTIYAGNLITPTLSYDSSTGKLTGRINVDFKIGVLGNTDSEGFAIENASLDDIFRVNRTGETILGITGQSNVLKIHGDTGEDLTITKNLDGTVTVTNTNNETIVFRGNIDNTGYNIVTDLLSLNTQSFASLPISAMSGDVAVINDGDNVSYRGVATGGGSETVIVLYNGTQWLYS
jgi:hypothetical protein